MTACVFSVDDSPGLGNSPASIDGLQHTLQWSSMRIYLLTTEDRNGCSPLHGHGNVFFILIIPPVVNRLDCSGSCTVDFQVSRTRTPGTAPRSLAGLQAVVGSLCETIKDGNTR